MGKRRVPVLSGNEPDTTTLLRYQQPTDEMDLHGLHVAEAVQRTKAYLARKRLVVPGGVVRIITGKGNRSDQGPRLRPAVETLLQKSEDVHEWVRTIDGGSLLVRLGEK